MRLDRWFFLLVFSVGYTWLGYPALLWIGRQLWPRQRPVRARSEPSMSERSISEPTISEPTISEPTISIIIAVHNEEDHIAAKLENCLALLYAHDRLEFLVASDGSTDATEAIAMEFAQRDPRIRLLRSQGRAGKSGVQNLAVAHATGDILFFTDASARAQPDLLQQIAEDFADPEVGLVAPVVYLGEPDGSVAEGQGAYWRYELFLRQAESDLGILATASGAALAIRRELFRPLPLHYGDDCILPLDVRLQGRRVLQEPRAAVFDTMPHTIKGEFKARVRMTARNWTGTVSRHALLNPFRFPITAWGLVSHKLLRWLTPFFLALVYLINTWMVFRGELFGLWIAQSCFYGAAFAGWRLTLGQRCARVFGYPFAFCLANLGFLFGLVLVLRRQTVVTYK
jgi:cellulose synthase/poly-beta-1,6-N-acetylglucosamine synthase-like glycosyltransferase